MLTIEQAATRAGVAASTWRSYVSRGQAPSADERDEWGHPRWNESTVDYWLATRPGQGVKKHLQRHRGDDWGSPK
jgi:hypothetical protein